MHNGLLATLRNRLTNIASVELASVLSLLQDVAMNNAPDDRFLTHGSSFSSRKAYSLLSSDHELDLNAGYIWSSKAPIKVRIFGWLLCHDRLSGVFSTPKQQKDEAHHMVQFSVTPTAVVDDALGAKNAYRWLFAAGSPIKNRHLRLSLCTRSLLTDLL
ncbi:DEAD-box ATP-dependent RNA helicase 56 [Hordeum vulgare]|nr:DEAD-box ATP-dependent RNA helicase 56 [Hordeum vulgare]